MSKIKKAILEVEKTLAATATVKIDGKMVGSSYWGFYEVTPDFIYLYDRAPTGQDTCIRGELIHKIYIGDCEFEKREVGSQWEAYLRKEEEKDNLVINKKFYKFFRVLGNTKKRSFFKRLFMYLGFPVYPAPEHFVDWKGFSFPIKFKRRKKDAGKVSDDSKD